MTRQIPLEIISNDHPHLTQSLRNKLTLLKATFEAALIGNAAQDFADYKYRVGKIQGVADAIILCEAMEKDLRGD